MFYYQVCYTKNLHFHTLREVGNTYTDKLVATFEYITNKIGKNFNCFTKEELGKHFGTCCTSYA